MRVGGGWETLDTWLVKHDPCRKGKRVSGFGLESDSGQRGRRESSYRVVLLEFQFRGA